MGEVISFSSWGKKDNRDEIVGKMVQCDKFIRSRFVPPPLGSLVFNFATGKVTVTGESTNIHGEDCEIVIRDGDVQLLGDSEHAVTLFCCIHREIEMLNPHALAAVAAAAAAPLEA